MLKIRFTRVGRRHDPTFRLIVTDSRKAPRSGAYLEKLGFRNPKTNETNLDKERIEYWLSQGAKVSDTVHNLLVEHKIIKGEKIDVSAKSKKEATPAEEVEIAKADEDTEAPTEASTEEVADTPKEETPVEEEKPAEDTKEESEVEKEEK